MGVNNLPKVVTQRHLEHDLNLRPVDRKPKRLACCTTALRYEYVKMQLQSWKNFLVSPITKSAIVLIYEMPYAEGRERERKGRRGEGRQVRTPPSINPGYTAMK